MPVHRWIEKLNLGRTVNVDKVLLANLGSLVTGTDIPLHCRLVLTASQVQQQK